MNSNTEIQIDSPQNDDKLIKRSLLFVPGLYVVLIMSGILIIVIGLSLLYILENALSGLISAFSFHIAIAVGAGMILGILGVLKGLHRAIWKKVHFEVAVEIKKDDEPQLFNLIEQLCFEMDCEAPNVVILHAEPTFFVMDGKLKLINGEVYGRVLCLSMPMVSFLSVNELRAVLAHEFAHFTGWDVEYSKKVVPVYSGVLAAVKQMNSGVSNSNLANAPLMSITNFLPIVMLKLYLNLFHKINMSLSRTREKRADVISAITCGTHSFTEAIKKIVSIGNVFETASLQHLTGEYRNGRGFINYYQIFRNHVEDMRGYIQQELEFEMNRLSVQKDSHPTLSERINYMPNVAEKYSDVQPALNLFIHSLQYEQVLSDEYSKALNNQK